MFKTMAKWISPAQYTTTEIDINKKDVEEGVCLPELDGIDIQTGLGITQGDKRLYKKLLIKFLASQGDFEDQFNEALGSDDKNAAERCAHTLKGVSGNIGAKQVQLAAANLEDVCRQNSSSNIISHHFNILNKLLCKVKASISSLDSNQINNNVDYGELDKVEFGRLLQRLRCLLQDDDTGALDVIDEMHNLPGISEYEEVLKRLTYSIDRYDFEAALEVLNNLDN